MAPPIVSPHTRGLSYPVVSRDARHCRDGTPHDATRRLPSVALVSPHGRSLLEGHAPKLPPHTMSRQIPSNSRACQPLQERTGRRRPVHPEQADHPFPMIVPPSHLVTTVASSPVMSVRAATPLACARVPDLPSQAAPSALAAAPAVAWARAPSENEPTPTAPAPEEMAATVVVAAVAPSPPPELWTHVGRASSVPLPPEAATMPPVEEQPVDPLDNGMHLSGASATSTEAEDFAGAVAGIFSSSACCLSVELADDPEARVPQSDGDWARQSQRGDGKWDGRQCANQGCTLPSYHVGLCVPSAPEKRSRGQPADKVRTHSSHPAVSPAVLGETLLPPPVSM